MNKEIVDVLLKILEYEVIALYEASKPIDTSVLCNMSKKQIIAYEKQKKEDIEACKKKVDITKNDIKNILSK